MKGHTIALVFLLGGFSGLIIGHFTTSAARPARTVVVPPQPGCKPMLQSPIDWDIYVVQSGPGIRDPQPRYYKGGQ